MGIEEENKMQSEEIVSVLKKKLNNYVGSINSASVRYAIKSHVIVAIKAIIELIYPNSKVPRVYLIQNQLAQGFIVVLSTHPEFVEQWRRFGFAVLPETDLICSRCKHPLVGIGSGTKCLNCWSPKITDEVKAILGEI